MKSAHQRCRGVVVLLVIALSVVFASCQNGTSDASTDADSDPETASDSQTESDSASNSSSDEATTPESFCRDFSQRVCDGLVACGCRFDQRAYDAEHCVESRAADCLANFEAKVGPDIAAGRARFDEVSVAACLAATELQSQRCVLGTGMGAPLADECSAFVVAAALVGEPCQLAGEGLAFCGVDGQGICLEGESAVICTALPGEGAPCLLGLCASGLVCNGSTCTTKGALGVTCETPGACQDILVCDPTGHCAAPLAAGLACDTNAQCQAGLACDQNECTALSELGEDCTGPQACGAERSCGRAPETRLCADPGGSGERCEENTCSAGLACASSTTKTCVALPSADEPCLDGFYCAEGLTCLFDLDSTCGPLASLGETCTAGIRFCADGLGCRQSDNTCQDGPGVGEECYDNPPDSVCGPGLGCDFGPEGSLCAPVTGESSACNSDRTCTADTYCDWSTMECTPRLSAGEPCRYGNECLPGHECTAEPSGVTCKPLPTRDQPCVYDCVEGLVCKGAGGQCVREFCVIPG